MWDQVIFIIMVFIVTSVLSGFFAEFVARPKPAIYIEDDFIVFHDIVPACKTIESAIPSYVAPVEWAKTQDSAGFVLFENGEIVFIKAPGASSFSYNDNGVSEIVHSIPKKTEKKMSHFIGLHPKIVQAFERFELSNPNIYKEINTRRHCLSVYHCLPMRGTTVYIKLSSLGLFNN